MRQHGVVGLNERPCHLVSRHMSRISHLITLSRLTVKNDNRVAFCLLVLPPHALALYMLTVSRVFSYYSYIKLDIQCNNEAGDHVPRIHVCRE